MTPAGGPDPLARRLITSMGSSETIQLLHGFRASSVHHRVRAVVVVRAVEGCPGRSRQRPRFALGVECRTALSRRLHATHTRRSASPREREPRRAARRGTGWRYQSKLIVSTNSVRAFSVKGDADAHRYENQPLKRREVWQNVRFGDRVFRAGDVVTNMAKTYDVKTARLSVFKGGKRE